MAQARAVGWKRLSYPSVAESYFPGIPGGQKIGGRGDRLAATISPGSVIAPAPPLKLDYSLTGLNSASPSRRDSPRRSGTNARCRARPCARSWSAATGPRSATRSSGSRSFLASAATYTLWGTWWALLPYIVYAVLYASTSDSRWHEAGHGTAFKTDWMNNALYEIASFMVMRESTVWRWSHTRHHSDTIIVGRDPEIAVPRPPNLKAIVMRFFNLGAYPIYFRKILLHSLGRMTADEKTFIPETEFAKVYRRARIYVAIYAAVIGLSIYTRSILPFFFVGLTNLFGTWLMVIYGLTQHAGLAENVLDHRLNCRTVYMDPINRYLYWNMNYHVDHHMFPLVPYHALPRLHAVVKDDCPRRTPASSRAWREIVPTILRQDKRSRVSREAPAARAEGHGSNEAGAIRRMAVPDATAGSKVCAAADLGRADVIRFDHGKKTFALYRDAGGRALRDRRHLHARQHPSRPRAS